MRHLAEISRLMNAFDDFSKTAYAGDNMPNLTGGDCVKKNFTGSRKKLENIVL